MKNNTILNFIEENCSPTTEEIDFVVKDYKKLKENILDTKTLQSGSWKRKTSITPVNDLDVIWEIGEENKNKYKKIDSDELDLENILEDLKHKLSEEYEMIGEKVKIRVQSRSVGIDFLDREHNFTIDIVPAIILDEKNEFGDSIYEIPEKQGTTEKWIRTDPRGYIKYIKNINDKNNNFRPAVKILKKWKSAWKRKYPEGENEFKLKSFHIELIVANICNEYEGLEVSDIINIFFSNLQSYITEKHFKDRARNIFIDNYIEDLNDYQINLIEIARKSALILLEKIDNTDEDEEHINFLYRLISGEEFIETYGFNFAKKLEEVYIQHKENNGDCKNGQCYIGKKKNVFFKIRFKKHKSSNTFDSEYYFKVRNTGNEAKNADCLRGDIRKSKSKELPVNERRESTLYKGRHIVIGYVVKNNIIVGYAKKIVNIE